MSPRNDRRKLDGATLALAAALLIFSPRGSADVPASCESRFASLLRPVQGARETIESRWAKLSTRQKQGWIASARDSIRYRLSVMHGHQYPSSALASDASTPLQAYALAKNAFGELSEKQKSLVDLDQVKRGVLRDLDSAENYPAEIKKYEDETATWVAQEKWITDQLRRHDLPSSGIQQIRPAVETAEQEARGWRFKDEANYTGYIGQLENERNELRKKISARLDPTYLGIIPRVPEDDRILAQAYLLKRLEIFFHEIRRQTVLHPDKKLPPDVQQIYDRISGLYEPGLSKFKAAATPPEWAWQKMHWAWFWGETKAVVTKDIPALKDKVEGNNLIRFAGTIEPSELKKVSGTNLSHTLGIVGRTKWFQLVLGLGGAAGVAEVENVAVKFFFHNRMAREACARTVDSTEAADKIRKYLESKFAGKPLWNAKGELVYPPAIAEVNAIARLREGYLGLKNRENRQENSILKLIIRPAPPSRPAPDPG